MMVTMTTITASLGRTALLVGATALAAAGLSAAPAAATVPSDVGWITVGDPWGGPARDLHATVDSTCTKVDGVAHPTLQVSTHDPVWEEHLRSTGGLSGELPITRTTAEIHWHNRITDEIDHRVEHGINGMVTTAPWPVEPGLTDVEIYLTQTPGLPVEIGAVGPHTGREALTVTVTGCPAQ